MYITNSDVVNIGSIEILPILSGTILKEKEASRKDNKIASVSEKELWKNTQNNSSNKKGNYPAKEKFVDYAKSLIILGDSMIKHLKGWKMSRKVNNPGCKIYVKYSRGVKTTCMNDYMQPSSSIMLALMTWTLTKH